MMHTFMTLAAAASVVCASAAMAQPTGIRRIDLQRHDISIPGREMIQVRVEFAPGSVFPRHRHPGEEIIYILEGALEYRIEGNRTTTYKAGDALMVPAGAIHSVKNVGADQAAELATYVVEKGKPLLEFVK
jgi:quercetin dioxygenase-like cupin family protein